jgi:hypothetical protein
MKWIKKFFKKNKRDHNAPHESDNSEVQNAQSFNDISSDSTVVNEPITKTAAPLRNKTDALVFDSKRRIFVIKKRLQTVALYDPAAHLIRIKYHDGTEQRIPCEAALSERSLPLAGYWYQPEHCDVGLYCSAHGAFFLNHSQNSKRQIIESRIFNTDRIMMPVVGDWQGNGMQSIGLYDTETATFLIKSQVSEDKNDVVFSFGSNLHSSIPLTGDWNGDGKDSVGLYLPESGVFFLHNTLEECLSADMNFHFGPPNSGMLPLVGDWNGDGLDSIGLYSPEQGLFYLHNKNEGADKIDHAFHFGPAQPGLKPLIGDWNGTKKTSIGVFDPASVTCYLTNALSGGHADLVLSFNGASPLSIPFVVSYLI